MLAASLWLVVGCPEAQDDDTSTSDDDSATGDDDDTVGYFGHVALAVQDESTAMARS